MENDNPSQESSRDEPAQKREKEREEEAGGLVGSLKKVLMIPGNLIKGAADAVINTSRFITSSQYRNQVGYPWLKDIVVRNKNAVWKEIGESEEMLRLLWRYGNGHTLTKAEQKQVRDQLLDLAKVVPALGIFALPGGAVLLPMLARALPWDLLPSSFRKKEGISEKDVEEMEEGNEMTNDE